MDYSRTAGSALRKADRYTYTQKSVAHRDYGRSVSGDRCVGQTDSGELINAVAAKPLSAGERTSLSLRPERVCLQPASASDNCFEVEFCEVIYHGDHLRTRVSLCGQDDFVIKTPNALGLVPQAPGQRMRVGWAAQDCRALGS